MKLVTLWQLHFDGRGSNKAKYAIVCRIRSEDVNVKVCLNHRHQAIGEKNGRGSLGENQKSPKKLLWKEGSHQAGRGLPSLWDLGPFTRGHGVSWSPCCVKSMEMSWGPGRGAGKKNLTIQTSVPVLLPAVHALGDNGPRSTPQPQSPPRVIHAVYTGAKSSQRCQKCPPSCPHWQALCHILSH